MSANAGQDALGQKCASNIHSKWQARFGADFMQTRSYAVFEEDTLVEKIAMGKRQARSAHRFSMNADFPFDDLGC